MMLFWIELSVTLLSNLADFATEMEFGREKPEHANAPIANCSCYFSSALNWQWSLTQSERLTGLSLVMVWKRNIDLWLRVWPEGIQQTFRQIQRFWDITVNVTVTSTLFLPLYFHLDVCRLDSVMCL